ncbi:hypothetical protein FOL47_001043 [Perkinsus chesapeaki]|uniref:Uncharacterized protein n=1 Tax=Perkinsus chesapeaki TaxID=330153 RepID=A0A7J6KTB1_PERCH|nr:hypothetical protein FOL47_001043 [Perkinsus chesapeaki]
MSTAASKEMWKCAYCPISEPAMRYDNLVRHTHKVHPGRPVKPRPPAGTRDIMSAFGAKRVLSDDPSGPEPKAHRRQGDASRSGEGEGPHRYLDDPHHVPAFGGSSSSSSSTSSTLRPIVAATGQTPSSSSSSQPARPWSGAPSDRPDASGLPVHDPLTEASGSAVAPAGRAFGRREGATLANQEHIIRELASLKSSLDKVLEVEASKHARSDFVTAVKSVSPEFRVDWTSGLVICSVCEKHKYKLSRSDLPVQAERTGKFDIGGPALTAAKKRTLLESLKTHGGTATHKRCAELGQKAADDVAHKVRMNVARVAYLTVIEGDSFSRFERSVAALALAGSSVGDQNHSRRFMDNFLVAMRLELLARMTYVITAPRASLGNRCCPFGIATDKVTLSKRTLQPLSVTTISNGLITSYLVGSPVASDKSGLGLASLALDTILGMGLSKEFVSKNCVSLSTDGEYLNLRAGERLSELLGVDDDAQLYHGWDIAHRLELCHDDAHKTVDLRGMLHSEVKSQIGSSYERTRMAAESIGVKFYSPLSYCKTRWASSERRVLVNFGRNLRAIYHADGCPDRPKYLEAGWVCTYVVVLNSMVSASLISQKVTLRPWQVWKAVCDHRDRLILAEVELQLFIESAKADTLSQSDFKLESFPSFAKFNIEEETWCGLPLWWSSKYKLHQVIVYYCEQASSWLHLLIHALGSRILHDIPEWLRLSEYSLGAEALLGQERLELLKHSYDMPVAPGDGSFQAADELVRSRNEAFRELSAWVANYASYDFDLDKLDSQYELLVQRVRDLTKDAEAGTIDICELWQRVHCMPSVFTGIEDALYICAHASLKASTESIVESQCSSLGAIDDRRHISSQGRADTALLTWNRIGLDHQEQFLEGSLRRMPPSFRGFTRSGRQFFRDKKYRVSQVVDRHLSDTSRTEIANVPMGAINRNRLDIPDDNNGDSSDTEAKHSDSSNDE